MKLLLTLIVSTIILVGVIRSNNNQQELSHHVRRLTEGSDPKSVIQKELSIKGTVCEMGGLHWTNDEILQHLDSFLDAWNERIGVFSSIDKTGVNNGGNGLFHSFILWAAIKELKPTLIVESGVHMGATSWLIEKASQDWGATLAFVDPMIKGWLPTSASGRTVHDFRGKGKFKDFTALPWDEIQADRSNALVFFDDHMDQLRRLQEAQQLGFVHVMFDDNYIAGTGDIFSIKNACDHHGQVRAVFTNNNAVPKRCDMFHRACKELTPQQGLEAFDDLVGLVDILWEGPPLTELYQAYVDVKTFTKRGRYEGPRPWIADVHDRLARESTKDPLFPNGEEILEKFNFETHRLHLEAGRYMNIVYIKLKRPGLQAEN